MQNKRSISKIWVQLFIFSIIALLVGFLTSIYLANTGHITQTFLHGIYYSLMCCVILFFINPKSKMYELSLDDSITCKLGIIIAILITSVIVIAPMSINPQYNGQEPAHRDQYKELADAFIDGRQNVHPGADTNKLHSLENPYEPAISAANNLVLNDDYYWDHVFFNGKYYVYFGVIPTLLLFLPYKVLFGVALTTWKATAVFAFFCIIVIYLFGYRIIKKYHSSIPLAVYLVLCSAVSQMLLWCATMYPALYCTAIVSGLCFLLWALYFIFMSFEYNEQPSLNYTIAAGICAAFVFGCRPTLGFTEIILLPFIFSYIRKQFINRKPSKELLSQALAFAIPLIITAIGLMIYNYTRFGSPLEFGEKYQLTLGDQTHNLDLFHINWRFFIIDALNYAGDTLFGFENLSIDFPWIVNADGIGLIALFPIILSALRRWNTTSNTMKSFRISLLIMPVFIISLQVMASTRQFLRYHMDFWFMWTLCMMIFCILSYTKKDDSHMRTVSLNLGFMYLSLYTMFIAFLLFFTGGDWSLVETNGALYNGIVDFLIGH